jgi:hypothetical protein
MHQTITFVRHPAPSYGFESGHDNNFLFINGIQPTTSVPYACVTGLRQQILSVNVVLHTPSHLLIYLNILMTYLYFCLLYIHCFIRLYVFLRFSHISK